MTIWYLLFGHDLIMHAERQKKEVNFAFPMTSFELRYHKGEIVILITIYVKSDQVKCR